MRHLTHAEISKVRRTPKASVLLFITDRCPVGCAHCSVDSRPDSPRVTDFRLLSEIVDQLCADPYLSMVGISGGEPFIERRALSSATHRLSESGKSIVVYTSGIWAGSADPPQWIDDVLAQAAAIYLSTDAFHEEGTGADKFVNAARAVARHGVPIVVQVIDQDGMRERAEDLLTVAFGREWPQHAEIVPTIGLPRGRGSALYTWGNRAPARSMGTCDSVTSPVIRYDGRVTACCNETVVMGGGPTALRRDCSSGADVAQAVAAFRNEPLCRTLASAGVGVLTTHHPAFSDLADREFSNICGACWAITRRARDTAPDPLLTALGLIGLDSP
ncbi:4Fe-4S single cluster domain-containing protein [Streptomyces sp. 2231.1]|uniref:radical SAM protein n=1 Tax=Streptomyces sp. 2231.1 TaxID=1855347 RepID=UPI00089CF3B5|nr:radical SAM protein [Streptomyces sp. 2231.1]SEE65661.1 4Fe-4S single cluster domain-containing protein [Streptomyces sp. 2231.1]